jgi:hypothetical protein
MVIHPDVQERNSKITQCLSVAVPGTRKSESGYRAISSISTLELSDPLKENLSQILVGEWNEQASLFIALVCDNNELPIEFETEQEALNQAITLTDSLVRRYSYGLFATYGILTANNQDDPAQGATLHFFKNGRPESKS